MFTPRRVLAGLVGALIALTTVPASADPLAHAAPPATADRPDTGMDLERRLDRALRAIVRAGAVGVVARVQGPGQSWRGAAGRADLHPRRPALKTARFRAASVNKQLTAVLALKLVERGTWSLDTTIDDVLPGLWPGRGQITLRQLMSHTSGMPDYLPVLLKDATTARALVDVISRQRTNRELVRTAQTQEWLFEPGTDMSYSNTNFVVVGMMLKEETGRPMPLLVRNRILRPVGMNDSRFATGRRLPGPALREYGVIGGKRVDMRRFHPSIFSSAGALVTTTRDLNDFQRALSRGRLIGPDLLGRMRSVIGRDPEAGLDYGLGSFRIPDPCREGRFVHGHDGATWGTLTLSFASRDGRRRMTVAMTGRDLDGRVASSRALGRFVVRALAATCGRAPDSVRGLERGPSLGYQTGLDLGSLTADGDPDGLTG
ncbi:MAG TPA: serine hydrolase domain-containing protein [Blastococcus sp.]|nr:serine hydrolase domain-containing protein [Blastococcus sp.]